MNHHRRPSLGFSSLFPRAVAGLLATLTLVALSGCAAAEDPEPVDSVDQGLTGGCSSAFASCVRGGGGGGCAARYCTGACVSDVERCARGGGGAACANKCSATACVPRDEWTKVGTSECGIQIPPFEGTTGGEARATCTTQCNGQRTCSIWHDARGRAVCTIGAPVDAAGNYW